MKKIALLLVIAGILSSCSQTPTITQTPIVQNEDYELIINNLLKSTDETAAQDRQIAFWEEKTSREKSGYLYHEKLGKLYNEKFESSGDLHYIHKANSHFDQAANYAKGNYKANMLLQQSSNFIKLHQFGKAKEKCLAAFSFSNDSFGVSMMLFDALMELGDYNEAGEIMEIYAGTTSFDYLVRYGKYLDHLGDLDAAIIHTERALSSLTSIEKNKNNWVSTHLADMYGHQGEIRKSYKSYISVLEEDPHNLHALRGIGWIAYSYDRNYDIAQEIFEHIAKTTALPDAHLMLADIAAAQDLNLEQKSQEDKFLSLVRSKQLEDLYNDYLIGLYVEEEPQKALRLAESECMERKTPSIYVSLAKAHYYNNQHGEAKRILENEVLGKTFEPGNIYESGKILMNIGEKQKGRLLLQEVSDAAFELGPIVQKDIEQLLELS